MNASSCRGVLCAVLVLRAATAHAHALASTIVSVTMTRPGTLEVTIAAEADPFIAKLEALAGIATSDPPTTREGRRSRIESLFPTLRSHIDGRVTGIPLVLELQDVAVDDTAQVEMHLTAKVGDGPQTFSWRSTFIFGAYQLATRSGGAAERVEWLQGPQTSAPITLEPIHATGGASVGGSTGLRIGHGLAMCVLVVYILRRRRNAQRLAGR
jgi:hypothetical protein